MTTSFPPINYPNKPVPPFTAPAPRNPFPGFYPDMWRNITGKPYITVSSKGLANGLSEYFNDGADFGPDSLQAEGSLTQTSGIQEAINYAVSTGNTTIMLKNGIYYLTNDFTVNDTYGVQYQIIFPPTSTVTHLRFTSESPVQLGIQNGSMATTGAIIYSKPPSYPSVSDSPYPWVMFVAPQYDLEIDVLIRQVGTTQQVNGINLYGAYTHSGNIRCDIDAVMDSGAPSTPPSGLSTLPVASAIQSPNENYGEGFNRLSISVFGYSQGILLNSQTEIESANFSYVFAPVQVSSTLHPKIIHYINNNNCTHLFDLGAAGTQYTEIYVELADIQDNLNTTSWFKTVDHVYYGNPVSTSHSFDGTNCAGLIRGVRNPQGSTIPYNSPLIIGGSLDSAVSTLRVETADTSVLTPTISANPPVSGTVYQNTNPYPIEIDLPVYATTSGTAGYVSIAKGSTDTPSSIGNQYVSGDTSDTAEQIIRLRVPAGWYYEFTASGVTFGTASVFAD